jgi:predicted sulfurtransferase
MAVPVPAVARLQAQVKADTGLDVDINGGEVLPRARFPLASKDSEAEVVGAEEGGEAVSTHASAQQQPLPPFQRLAVIVRPQVLADGLPRPLDLSRVPAPLSPQDWHAQLPNAAIVLDVRNDYEFEVGRFANATPLETRTFRETWPALDRLLAPITDKTAPVVRFPF